MNVNYKPTLPKNIIANTVLKCAMNRKSGIKFGYFNARSIVNKMDEIKLLLSGVRFDIVGVTETWLKNHINDEFVSLDGYNCIRNDRNSNRGGGLCVFVRSGWHYKLIHMSSTPNLEILLIEIIINSFKMLVGIVYKPPHKFFINELNDILGQFASQYGDIVLFGDFNCDILKNSSSMKNFSSALKSYSLNIFNKEPTYFCGTSASLLDLLITNKKRIQFFNQISVGCFDHDLLFWTYEAPMFDSGRTILYRDYKHINIATLLQECSDLDWDAIYNYCGVNQKLDIFNKLVIYLFEKHVPLRTARTRANRPPWFTNEIKNLINLRDYALSMWKTNKKLETRRSYTKIRNNVTEKIRNEKAAYLNRIFNSKLPQGKFWKLVNKIGCSSKSVNLDSKFSTREFCEEFSSNHNTNLRTDCNMNYFQINPRDFELSFRCIDCLTLEKTLNSVNSESIGLDNIPIKFLKIVFPVINSYVLHIFNYMITSSNFPDIWKFAKLIPFPKTKNPNSLADYRPISILPSLSKVFERILKNQITEHLDKHNLLDHHQSAYRKSYSTSSAVLHIVDDMRRSVDSSKATILVLLDFKKAFDSVYHHTLIRKLYNNFIFSSSACKLIENYLCDRKFIVSSQDTYSDVTRTTCGVPQGSVLGPLLFSLYINDLPSVLQNCEHHLFADDVQIYVNCSVRDLYDGVRSINQNVRAIEDWAKLNNLKLNPKKTQAMVVYRNKIDTSLCPLVTVCNEDIPFSDCVNDLGILINNRLTWDEHVNSICGKTYRKIRCLWAATNFASQELRHKLFLAYVFPYFTYGDLVLYGMHQYNMDLLNNAFKAGVRYINRLRKFDHISLFLPNVIGSSLIEYYKFRICFSIYKLVKCRTPSYLFSKLDMSNLSRNRTLIIPRNSTHVFNSSFFVKGVGCFNSLPMYVKSAVSSASFKKLYFAKF